MPAITLPDGSARLFEGAVTGTTTTVSFRNSRPPLPDNIYRAQLAGAKAFECTNMPPGVKPPPGFGPARSAARTVTFAAAIATANQAAGLTAARSKKLKALPMAKTTVGDCSSG